MSRPHSRWPKLVRCPRLWQRPLALVTWSLNVGNDVIKKGEENSSCGVPMCAGLQTEPPLPKRHAAAKSQEAQEKKRQEKAQTLQSVRVALTPEPPTRCDSFQPLSRGDASRGHAARLRHMTSAPCGWDLKEAVSRQDSVIFPEVCDRWNLCKILRIWFTQTTIKWKHWSGECDASVI